MLSRGDWVKTVGGRHRGVRGTLLKKNGVNCLVVVHADDEILVRTLDGQTYCVKIAALRKVSPVAFLSEYVVPVE